MIYNGLAKTFLFLFVFFLCLSVIYYYILLQFVVFVKQERKVKLTLFEEKQNEKQKELEEICDKYPIEIPVPVAAKWLGIAPESLRHSILQGTCGFAALAWHKPGKSNAGFHIPTANFYKAFAVKLEGGYDR